MAAAGPGRRIDEMLGQRRRRPLGPRTRTGATGTVPGNRSRFTPGEPTIARNPDNAARHIRLRSLQVRELSGLTMAAAADLLAKAATAGVAMKTDQNESLPGLDGARRPPGARGRFAHGVALCLHASGVGRLGATRRGRVAAASRRAASIWASLRSARAKIDLLQDAALVWRPRQDCASGNWSFGTGLAAN